METHKISRFVRSIYEDPYKSFFRQAASSEIKLVSVDIFDTLLLRTTRPEAQRFRDISALWADEIRYTSESVTAEKLFFLRLLAAKFSYRNVLPVKGVREADYESIILTTLHGAKLPTSMVREFLEIELEYEIGMMRLNERLAKVLRSCREQGKRVIAVSDMYFGAETLEQLLGNYCEKELIQRIYSSADYGFTKSSGLIFPQILGEEKISKREWTHCGDNYHSDCMMPADFGIPSHHTPRHPIWRLIAKVRRNYYAAHKGLHSL